MFGNLSRLRQWTRQPNLGRSGEADSWPPAIVGALQACRSRSQYVSEPRCADAPSQWSSCTCPGEPLRELRAPHHRAFVFALALLGVLLTLWLFGAGKFAVCLHGMFMLMVLGGEENGYER